MYYVQAGLPLLNYKQAPTDKRGIQEGENTMSLCTVILWIQNRIVVLPVLQEHKIISQFWRNWKHTGTFIGIFIWFSFILKIKISLNVWVRHTRYFMKICTCSKFIYSHPTWVALEDRCLAPLRPTLPERSRVAVCVCNGEVPFWKKKKKKNLTRKKSVFRTFASGPVKVGGCSIVNKTKQHIYLKYLNVCTFKVYVKEEKQDWQYGRAIFNAHQIPPLFATFVHYSSKPR